MPCQVLTDGVHCCLGSMTGVGLWGSWSLPPPRCPEQYTGDAPGASFSPWTRVPVNRSQADHQNGQAMFGGLWDSGPRCHAHGDFGIGIHMGWLKAFAEPQGDSSWGYNRLWQPVLSCVGTSSSTGSWALKLHFPGSEPSPLASLPWDCPHSFSPVTGC